MNSVKKLENLIFRLQHIARRNDDAFSYRIEIEAIYVLHFTFKVVETVDHHLFLSGIGETLDEALDDAERGIDEACAAWDYKL